MFLYSAPDGGHTECASAVRKAFHLFHPAVETAGQDAARALFPLLGPMVAKTYLELVQSAPQLWNFLYNHDGLEKITRGFRQILSLPSETRLNALLSEHAPSIAVCTHAMPCNILAARKQSGRMRAPLVGIVTDFTVHAYWAHSSVDLYLVANRESAEALTERGVPRHRVRVCGIPVDPAFAERQSRAEARRRLGLDARKPVVLVMGGSKGLGPIANMVRALSELKPAPQIIAVTGTNEALHKKLMSRKTANLHVFGFTRRMPLLMDASDLLITKPGGITSSEALVKRLPMLLVNPLPGQEERNARWLMNHGAAASAKNFRETVTAARDLLKNTDQLKMLSERAQALSAPNAARDAAKAILELTRSKSGQEAGLAPGASR